MRDLGCYSRILGHEVLKQDQSGTGAQRSKLLMDIGCTSGPTTVL